MMMMFLSLGNVYESCVCILNMYFEMGMVRGLILAYFVLSENELSVSLD